MPFDTRYPYGYMVIWQYGHIAILMQQSGKMRARVVRWLIFLYIFRNFLCKHKKWFLHWWWNIWFMCANFVKMYTFNFAFYKCLQVCKRLSVCIIVCTCLRFREIPPDPTECGCLKTIVLFKPETAGIVDPRSVELLQDQAQCILADYIRNRYISQPTR